jgi:hypothetical protein
LNTTSVVVAVLGVSDEDKSSELSDDSFDAYEILGTPLFNGLRNRLAKKQEDSVHFNEFLLLNFYEVFVDFLIFLSLNYYYLNVLRAFVLWLLLAVDDLYFHLHPNYQD